MKFHISIMKHLVNQEILKVQKPLSIMDLNCQYVVWQDIKSTSPRLRADLSRSELSAGRVVRHSLLLGYGISTIKFCVNNHKSKITMTRWRNEIQKLSKLRGENLAPLFC
jgi:hypothetical protein